MKMSKGRKPTEESSTEEEDSDEEDSEKEGWTDEGSEDGSTDDGDSSDDDRSTDEGDSDIEKIPNAVPDNILSNNNAVQDDNTSGAVGTTITPQLVLYKKITKTNQEKQLADKTDNEDQNTRKPISNKLILFALSDDKLASKVDECKGWTLCTPNGDVKLGNENLKENKDKI